MSNLAKSILESHNHLNFTIEFQENVRRCKVVYHLGRTSFKIYNLLVTEQPEVYWPSSIFNPNQRLKHTFLKVNQIKLQGRFRPLFCPVKRLHNNFCAYMDGMAFPRAGIEQKNCQMTWPKYSQFSILVCIRLCFIDPKDGEICVLVISTSFSTYNLFSYQTMCLHLQKLVYDIEEP